MAELQNTTINDKEFLYLPVGTTGERPANPDQGMIRFNSTESYVEGYDGSEWVQLGGGAGLYEFTSATFTVGSNRGTSGPNLTQARNGLSGPGVNNWKNNTQFFNVSSGIQEWTVPANGTYRINAYGARSGDYTTYGNTSRGARMQGDFDLQQGEILQLLIGQEGSGGSGYGGGGATYVVRSPYNTLNSCILAAGGAGGTHPGRPPTLPNQHGWTNSSGQPGITNNPQTSGGTNGQGGTGQGGGGAGFLTPGSQTGGSPSNAFGFSYLDGGQGGDSGRGSDGQGGFGGGGGYTNSWGGGGGGYSGGGGGGSTPWQGGGGGSINRGINQVNQTGVNNDDGRVEITLL